MKPLIESNPEAFHPVTRAIIESARKFDAVAAFEAFYRLADRKRRTSRAWSDFDVMLVPTMPRFYTVAEVEADPVRLNSRLGTYTNFVNLLDLCAIAVPAGIRGDGLPSSVTLIAPSGADGLIAGLAAAIQARSGGPAKAAASARPASRALARKPSGSKSRSWARISPGCRSIASSSISARRFRAKSKRRPTTACSRYPVRLQPNRDCSGSPTAQAPRSRPRSGRSTAPASATFVARIPAPLGIGTIRLNDGGSVKGFLVEAEAVKAAEDISRFGGWRAYLASR